jgi:hypothetical protein
VKSEKRREYLCPASGSCNPLVSGSSIRVNTFGDGEAVTDNKMQESVSDSGKKIFDLVFYP